MSKTDDLEKIDIPWKMLLALSILATALVIAYPTFNWIRYHLLQFRLQELAAKKTQDIDFASIEQALPQIHSKHYPITLESPPGTTDPSEVSYFLFGICRQSDCAGISPKKRPIQASLPPDLTEEDLSSWANKSCAELHGYGQTPAAGAIVYKDDKPFALLCAVSRKAW